MGSRTFELRQLEMIDSSCRYKVRTLRSHYLHRSKLHQHYKTTILKVLANQHYICNHENFHHLHSSYLFPLLGFGVCFTRRYVFQRQRRPGRMR